MFLNTYNYELLSQEQDKREKEVFVLTSNDFIISYLNLLISLNKNSAIGDLHMLPRHTNKTFVIFILLYHINLYLLIEKLS